MRRTASRRRTPVKGLAEPGGRRSRVSGARCLATRKARGVTGNVTKRRSGEDWIVPLYVESRNRGEMAWHRLSPRYRATFGALPPDFYVVPGPWPPLGRPLKHDVEALRVIDDWPGRVPITEAEIGVFEGWFGDLFGELLGPSR